MIEEKIDEIVKQYIDETTRDCYEIVYTNENPSILDDKIGGTPYLPIGEEYPKDKYGNPMALLFQANLTNLELSNYPKGVLEIFLSTNKDDVCGSYELAKDCYLIKVYEEGLEYQENIEYVPLDMFINHPIKVKLEKKEMSFPFNMSDDQIVNYLLDLIERKFNITLNNPMDIKNKLNIDYDDLVDKLSDKTFGFANIGGYPWFINEPDVEYDTTKKCLAFIESDLEKGICFGADAGNILVLSNKVDIINKDYNNIYCNIEW